MTAWSLELMHITKYVVNPQNLNFWRSYNYFLQIVFDLAGCCEGFFFSHQGKNSPIIHFRLPVDSFILRMYQIVDSAPLTVFAVSLIFNSPLMAFFTYLKFPFDFTVKVPQSSSQMKVQNLSSRPYYLVFICLIFHGIMR